MTSPYSASEATRVLTKLNLGIDTPWCIKQGKLNKTFTFSNFIDAFSFMNKVAMHSEKLNHHPEWSNVYNKVEIYLVTHEIKGLSAKDFELAQLINTLYPNT